jgi:hypothetical protein
MLLLFFLVFSIAWHVLLSFVSLHDIFLYVSSPKLFFLHLGRFDTQAVWLMLPPLVVVFHVFVIVQLA